jgi:hypothetical protein
VYFSEGRALPGRSVAVVACWLVLAAGMAGAWAMRGRAPGRLAILLAPVALAVITSVIAFGYPRFRYAADVSLIVLGAVLVERLSGPARALLKPRVRHRAPVLDGPHGPAEPLE